MNRLVALHRRFIQVEPYIGLFAMIGAFSFLWKGVQRFGQLTWPEAILAGTLLGCLVMIAVALTMIGWRVLRPLPLPRAGPISPEDAQAPRLEGPGSVPPELQDRLNRLGELEIFVAQLELKSRNIIHRAPEIIEVLDAEKRRKLDEEKIRLMKALSELEDGLSRQQPAPYGDALLQIRFALNRLGVPNQVLERMAGEQRSRITGNVRYYHRTDDEMDRWPSDDHKQSWHVTMAMIQCYKSIVEDVENYARP